MQSSASAEDLVHLPRAVPPPPADPEAAARGWERLRETLAGIGADDPRHARLAAALERAEAAPLLDAVFGNSPFLTGCILRVPDSLADYLLDGADAAFAAVLDGLPAPGSGLRPAEAEPLLRRARSRAALVIALADLSGHWDLERVTGALTDFADRAIGLALEAALAAQSRRPADDPLRSRIAASGFVLLGMGKLGARELNYSSDIDLIALYDRPKLAQWLDLPEENVQQAAVRATQAVTKLLQDRTRDGYVFRVDLRLRPDPGATQVALPVTAALSYYESYGQNWERAAMIKARPCAGDLEVGGWFLHELVPYIWRRNLDFASIADIMAVKRQIHSHKGHARIAAAGHDVKVGRGGIREVEFFAQTQQLIAGGREPSLRHRRTRDALRALEELQRINARTRREMQAGYDYLRMVEHRLQMIDDQQTQRLPSDPEAFRRFAIFMGYDGPAALEAELTRVLTCIGGHFDQLFHEPEAENQPGSLVFTGTDHDPDTLETLRGMGFAEPETVSRIVRDWHRARYPALRARAARERLTALMPDLLAAFGRTPNPDRALTGFDEFLSRLPTGIQLFALLIANRSLLGLLAEIMGGFPDLARHLSRHPILFDAMLDAHFYAPLPDAAAMQEDLRQRRAQARHEEDALRAACRWVRDRELQTAVQCLHGFAQVDQALEWLSRAADVALREVLAEVTRQHREVHGELPGGGFVLLALGRLGAREMLVDSDLDLIFVYDHAPEAEASDGAKPLAPGSYFARLGQRLIGAITAMTPDGRLYDVDMRLRPSGSSGPVATSLHAFRKYYREDAQTWELMALTKARAVGGDAALLPRVEEAIRELLAQPRDPEQVRLDAAAMRIRIRETHPGSAPWDMKHGRGGLVDNDFIWQSLALAHAPALAGLLPTAERPAAAAVLEALRDAGVLQPAEAERLLEARLLANTVVMAQRLAAGRGGTADVEAPQFQVTLARAAQRASFRHLRSDLDAARQEVAALFDRFVGGATAEAERPAAS